MALVAAALSGCGADEVEPAPLGPPGARHGQRALLEMTAVEDVRAGLASASDLYAAQRAPAARQHTQRARALYMAQVARGVGGRDRVLARELVAAFEAIDADMRAGAPLPALRERIGALRGQLLDAAEGLLVPAPARADAGARAEVLARTLAAMDRAYSYGLGPAAPLPEGRFYVERAYGLLARSQSSARGLAPSLGPQRDPVLLGLSDLRLRAFPAGVLRPPTAAPPGDVRERVRRLRGALRKQYRL